jgi:hypothetical protein
VAVFDLGHLLGTTVAATGAHEVGSVPVGASPVRPIDVDSHRLPTSTRGMPQGRAHRVARSARRQGLGLTTNGTLGGQIEQGANAG